MDTTNNTNEEQNVDSDKEFYGDNAITGNESDATEDTVVTQSDSSDQIQLNTDSGESTLAKDEQEETPKEEETKPEDIPKEAEELTEEVNKANKAIESLDKDLTAKGVDFNKAVEEYEADGKLSKSTMDALKKAGYPADVVDGFIASRQALEARYVNKVYEVAGGQKAFEEATAWAKDNLSTAEINSFNKAIDGGDVGTVKLMLDGINAKRVARYGTRNPSVVGGSTNVGSTKGFATTDDMIKAIGDPRYGRDARYTREVEQKVMNTSFM